MKLFKHIEQKLQRESRDSEVPVFIKRMAELFLEFIKNMSLWIQGGQHTLIKINKTSPHPDTSIMVKLQIRRQRENLKSNQQECLLDRE